jgi:hypothetical protein
MSVMRKQLQLDFGKEALSDVWKHALQNVIPHLVNELNVLQGEQGN